MDSENHFRLQLIIEYPVSNYKVWMSRLTPSNSKETPVLFQELVRLSEHVKIQEENENFLMQ